MEVDNFKHNQKQNIMKMNGKENQFEQNKNELNEVEKEFVLGREDEQLNFVFQKHLTFHTCKRNSLTSGIFPKSFEIFLLRPSLVPKKKCLPLSTG